jgi:putative phosphoesterase
MKFAVIADIHGNAPALSAVLDEIGEMMDIQHIYCLGDMIGIGPDTNEVLGILFNRKDVSMITGNHDEAILALLKGEQHPKSHLHAREHHQWIADRMDHIYVSKLESLPRTIKDTIKGHTILFSHYHIDARKMSYHISQDPFSSIVEPSLKNIQNLFTETNDDAVFFGHHHPVHYYKGEKTLYVNPGALGCCLEPEAPYAIVDIDTNNIKVFLKRAKYDKKEFLSSYEKLKVPDREFILKIFHGIK